MRKIRSLGEEGHMNATRSGYNILVGKSEERGLHGRNVYRRLYVKTGASEAGCEDWI